MGCRRLQVLFLALSLPAAPWLALGSSQSQQFQQAVDLMETKGDYRAAIRLFEEIAAGEDRGLAARALLYLGLCQEKLDRSRAEIAYRQLAKRFADQPELVGEARARLSALARPRLTPPTVLARQVWVGPDVDTQGAPSPDGRYLPYVVWETGDLAVRDLMAGTSRRLTGGGSWQAGHSLYSIVSADGKQTAYAWHNGKFYDLRSIGLDGSGPRVLYSSEEVPYIYPQEWSADGKAILALLFRKDKTTQIALVSADDGSVKVLKTLPWRWPQKMSLSADGRYVAYDLPQEEGSDILLLATDGSRELWSHIPPTTSRLSGPPTEEGSSF